MKKENIIKIEFNIYDGERSDIPSIYTDIEFNHFGYGDCFGHDGKAFWLDINQSLDEHEDVEPEHKELYKIIRGVIESLF